MSEPWAFREISGARLPHSKFHASLACIVEGLASSCGSSFSAGCGHGGRQSARRLFGNPALSIEGLLKGHFEQTAARCFGQSMVLAVQDTTVLDYTSHVSKKGLGSVDTSGYTRGLMAHSVLMLGLDGQPLGTFGVNIWSRGPITRGSNYADRKKLTSEKESGKWKWGLDQVLHHAPSSVPVLLIQDREADVFAFLAAKRRSNVHLLVRARWDRKVMVSGEAGDQEATLVTAVASAPVVASMTVTIPRAVKRAEREAVLTVRSTCATFKRPEWHALEKHLPQSLYVVDALEENPPKGETPIHWILLTTMPVNSPNDASSMVRYYSRRWMIERLHYVLKSGCSVERLQIDDVERLKMALGVYYLVAWRLMSLTYLARTAPDTPADTALSREEITVLSTATKREIHSMADAVAAIGILGGHEHYKNAPPPGPKRLWIGLRRLEDMAIGWSIARSTQARQVNQD